MAGNWKLTPTKRLILGAFDAVGSALFGVAWLLRGARARKAVPPDPRNILVIEPWHLGDNVLTTAALAAVRHVYPGARVTLLALPHAEVLLRGTDVADEIITFPFPWSVFDGKYLPWRYDPRAFAGLVRKLRARRFDLTIDARGDARQNVLAWLTGAPRRLGFDAGGGAFLLTDRAPARFEATHKLDDWLDLLRHVGAAAPPTLPRLAVTGDESEAGRRALADAGVRPGDLLVGIHPGASHPVKRWSLAGFAAVADALAERRGVRIVAFADPDGYGATLPTSTPTIALRLGLRELLGALSHCDLLVCNDSGPMHMASALGVPVVAVFTTGRPEWYGPLGAHHRVIHRPDLTCRPCFNRCVLAEPICNTTIRADEVIAAAEAAVGALAAARGPAAARA